MVFVPQTPFVAREGRRARIYAAPQWLTDDGGRLVPIDEVVEIDVFGDQAWQVTIGSRSLLLKPDAATRSAIDAGLRRDRNELGRRFGPVMASSDVPDVMRFAVEHSEGVTRTRAGDYVFETRDGLTLGVFFDDWRRQFGFSNVADAIAIDTTAAKSRAAAAGRDEIDFDPTTVSLASYYDAFYEGEALDWDTVHDASASNSGGTSSLIIQARRLFFSSHYIRRFALRFDTSGTALDGGTAVLVLTRTAGDTDSGNAHASLCAFDATPDADSYGQVRSGYEGSPLGVFSGESSTWTLDISGDYAQETTFDLGIAEFDHDVSDVQPSNGQNLTTTFDNASNPPYIEVTPAGGAVLPPSLLASGQYGSAV